MHSLEKLQADFETLKVRKEQALQNVHQIIGAMSIIEQYIQAILNPEPEKIPEEVQPEVENVEVNDQTTE